MNYKKISDLLNKEYLYSDLILKYMFDYTNSQLFLNRNKILNNDELNEFHKIQKKIKDGLPVQYAIGKWNFYGYDFDINENVLIPRPETELLVENILKENLDNKNILDIGTGSGAISISLYLEMKNIGVLNFSIDALDISSDALKVAKSNAKKYDAIINFFESDLFTNISEKKYDIIVSNPPYLSEKEYLDVDPLLYYEPKLALVGGFTGYEIYSKIVKEARKFLTHKGKLFLEIGYLQAEFIKKMLIDEGYNNIKIIKDYGQNDRVIIAEK